MNETRSLAALALCALLAVSCALAPGAAVATAAPVLSWTAPAPADGAGKPSAVSCPSEALCVGVDDAGQVLTTTDPTVAAPTWASAQIDTGQQLSAVSCASGALCIAVDRKGNALVGTNPTAGSAGWSGKPADPGHELTGVSCPTVSFCVAVDAVGNALVSEHPAQNLWGLAVDVDGSEHFSAVSCSSASLCVAVDTAGGVLVSREPAAGAGAWHRRALDAAGGLAAASCGMGGVVGPGSVGGAGVACVAVDASGDILASGDPTSATPTWSDTEADPGGALSGVSCAPLGQCVAVDGGGHALASEAPTLAPAAWSTASPDPDALAGVSCSAGSFCLALDTSGRSLSASLPPPVSLLAPPPTPRPSILGTPALGSQLTCQNGLAADATVQLSYLWLRELEPIVGATGPTYSVKAADEGHHLQCRVTASDASGSATSTSAFVSVPFQGLPVASGETLVGRARAHGARVLVPVACSTRAPHGCKLLLRLVGAGADRSTIDGIVDRPAATLAIMRVHLARGARRSVAVVLSARSRRLLARRHRLAVTLLVSGTVIGSIEAPLAEQRLVLGAGASLGRSVGARALAAFASTPPVQALAPAARAAAPAMRASAPAANAAGRSRAAASAATPYMGWDSYLAFGARYSESTVLEQASDLLTLGLVRRGYRFVWLDVGWWQGARTPDGQIALDRAQWPHGIAWLAGVLHGAGLLLGLYTDAGGDGCGGIGQGSDGHYRQDADAFAAWGVDAVKVDFCGGSRLGLDPAQAYSEFRAALDASGRPMLLSICDFLQPGEQGEGEPPPVRSAFSSYAFGPEVGASWRTDGDVGVPGHVSFGSVLRNLDADAAHPEAAGPGHWNDPDYLGPDQGMGVAQFRTQVSMWAMLAAPLMVSRDLGRLSRASLGTLENREVVAIDQDPLGAQGTLVTSEGAGQVWVKPLSDGSRAVALLNRGPVPLRIETSAGAVGLAPARRYAVRDLWAHRTSATSGALGAEVGRDSTVLLRVSVAG
ncbi:MAG TPA: glycoside hydrolase family 27 protein [Solirubrobacteraceae bacterium]|nr:glycoside hydrolase family 27 protein [Solirubrobacteraceae bacterium]